jgi:GalNAc-alpha-(1->4)-GalNAc-alpha-(1->3)-diNAcBac-PP-undecaprenol alpha-1,4-N-acetyl-D-galactosaminyltransferase
VTEKIVLIAPSIHMGGMQRAMVNIANQMSQMGLKVYFICIYKRPHFFKLAPDIHFVEPSEVIHQYGKVRRFFFAISNIRKNCQSIDAKKVLVFGRFYGALTLWALRGLPCEVYISDRASIDYRDAKHVDWLTRLIYFFLKPSGVICQTQDSLAFQETRFGKKIPKVVIPNPLTHLHLPPGERKNYVLSVGRFGDPLKGFDRLIEAWCRLESNGWELLFAGGDEADAQKEGYWTQLEQHGKLDSVKFLGKVDDVARWYASSKIFVIPSRSEGFPNALLEAMASHVACIAFDFHSGPRDLIVHMQNGILVKNGDISALADQISLLMKNEALRSALASSNNYADTYAPKSIVGQFLNFIYKKDGNNASALG